MSTLERIVSDDKTADQEEEWAPGGVFSELGAYRWVAWFVVLEVVLLVSGIVLDLSLDADIVGGLFAAFAVLLAIGAIAGVAMMGLYRAVSSVR
jgi:hypothetical protein